MASDQDENVALEEVRYVVPSWSLSRRAHSTLTRCPLQRLKSALWLAIGKIVDEETIKLGVNATPQFIGALTEMVWAQIGTYSVHITHPWTMLAMSCPVTVTAYLARIEDIASEDVHP